MQRGEIKTLKDLTELVYDMFTLNWRETCNELDKLIEECADDE
ncbi:MAG: hypothetical protein PWP49_141 [Thermococcaceae archaeon]|jgi:hypothetical protein|nr:hypothetical protein [Thermococcaceae archaeon]MDN5319721.1 hypothetical protein [Thermococcaceae archaeon]